MSNSSTITESGWIDPVHPGEVLIEDFIEGFGITQNKLAVSIGVPPGVSTRSCMASAASPRTPRSGLPGILVLLKSCG